MRGRALFSRWITDTGRRALVILDAGETRHQNWSVHPHEFGVVVCVRIPLAEGTEAPSCRKAPVPPHPESNSHRLTLGATTYSTNDCPAICPREHLAAGPPDLLAELH